MIQVYWSKFHSNPMSRKKVTIVLVRFSLGQVYQLGTEPIDESQHTINQRPIF